MMFMVFSGNGIGTIAVRPSFAHNDPFPKFNVSGLLFVSLHVLDGSISDGLSEILGWIRHRRYFNCIWARNGHVSSVAKQFGAD
jgi:hypothetical protein